MDRPNQVPQWATNPPDPGNVETPPLAAQRIGWGFRDKMPFQWVNWLWNQVSAWLGHYSQTSSVFKRLEDAVNAPVAAPLQLGATCLVDEDEGGASPGDILQEILVSELPAGHIVMAVAACATAVFVAAHEYGAQGTQAVTVVRLNRDGTTHPTMYTSSATNGVLRMWTDGHIVVLASYNLVECWDFASGDLLWSESVATPGLARGLAVDASHVYVTSGNNVIAFDRATGSTVWTYDHGEEVYALAVGRLGGQGVTAVYALGKSGGTNDSLQVIDAATGGPNSLDDPDVVSGAGAHLALDGMHLFVNRQDAPAPGETYKLEARSPVDSVVAWQADGSGSGHLTADQDWILIVTGGWGLHSKEHGATAALGIYSDGSPVLATSIASDGAALWVGVNTNANGVHLLKVARGNRIRHWRRVDPTNPDHAGYLVPLAQELVPA